MSRGLAKEAPQTDYHRPAISDSWGNTKCRLQSAAGESKKNSQKEESRDSTALTAGAAPTHLDHHSLRSDSVATRWRQFFFFSFLSPSVAVSLIAKEPTSGRITSELGPRRVAPTLAETYCPPSSGRLTLVFIFRFLYRWDSRLPSRGRWQAILSRRLQHAASDPLGVGRCLQPRLPCPART